ncbi:MAG: hypothetical protein GX046_08565 [Tissierellia bacterium]|nr:hypothetical protein [Tissierellia bacterium]
MNQGEILQIATPEKMLLHPKNDFVKEFFKGEGILTILSRKLAVDYAEPTILVGEPLDENATLRDVLTEMLLRGVEMITLINGSISWEKILKIAGSEINEFK